MKCEQQFQIGDIVEIVPEPVDTPVCWIRAMDKFCGETSVIENAVWDELCECWTYRLEDNMYWWSDNCFLPKEIPLDFEISEDEITSILRISK